MPRREKTSPLEDLIFLASKLPWWLSLGLALASYGGLHRLAQLHQGVPKDVAGLGSFAGLSLWVTSAKFLQYLLPIPLLIGAAVSAYTAFRNRRRFETTAALGEAGALLRMSWQAFEELVEEHYRRLGYQVTRTGKAGPDGGVDLELRKGSELSLVQCKQWRAMAVGVGVVRELYGVMAARGATHGYVVSSGKFTVDATKFASGRNISLVDGQRLIDTMRSTARSSGPPFASGVEVRDMTSSPCPLCAGPMIKRFAKRGANVGNSFWGCARYPACRGTRSIA